MAAPATSSSATPYWKCLAAALPLLVTGAGYALSAQPETGEGAAQRRWLTELMLLEQSVLHTMLVMLVLGWFFRGADRLRGIVICAFLFVSASALMSYRSGESWLAFTVLALVTYLGLALNWNSGAFWVQFLVRWSVSSAVFYLSLAYANVPRDDRQWLGQASVVEAGAIYFLVLAGLELSSLYQRVLPAFVRGWNRGFRKTG